MNPTACGVNNGEAPPDRSQARIHAPAWAGYICGRQDREENAYVHADATVTDFPMIDYLASPGSTAGCVAALERLLHGGAALRGAILLTRNGSNSKTQGLLLTDELGDRSGVKTGFASGYSVKGRESSPCSAGTASRSRRSRSTSQRSAGLTGRH